MVLEEATKGRSKWLVIVGYALTLVFFGLFTGRVNLLFYGNSAQDVFPLYAHASEIGQFSLLFCAGLLARSRSRVVSGFMPLLAVVLLVAGYALTLYQAVGENMPMWLSACAGAFFGGGQGASFLCWASVYSRMDSRRAADCMISSTLLSAIILVLIGCVPNTVALFSAMSIVVVLCCVMVVQGSSADGGGGALASNMGVPAEMTEGNNRVIAPHASFRNWAFTKRRSLLCLFALAFVCGAQRALSLEGFISQESSAIIFPLGYALGAVLFRGVLNIQRDEDDYYHVYTVLLAVMATCGVLSFVQRAGIQTVLYIVDNVAFTVISMCVVLMSVDAAKDTARSPMFTVGVTCGAMYFSIQLGRVVSNIVMGLTGAVTIGALVVSVIIVYVLALAAISSGVFVRQMAAEWNGEPQNGAAGAAADAVQLRASSREPGQEAHGSVGKGIISIASVTEDRLRTNPVYRSRFGLTERELDVLVLLLAGYNAPDISSLLEISVNTVKTHLKGIYAKLGAHNRREVIAILNEVELERP